MALSTEQVQRIKHIDDKTKWLINGYIRNAQKLLIDNNYHIIPDLVIITCLLYFSFFDTWDQQSIDNDDKVIKLDDHDTIRILADPKNIAHSIFLSQIITVSKHHNYNWKFKLIKYKNLYLFNVLIGIWNIDHEPDIFQVRIGEPWSKFNSEKYGLYCAYPYLLTPGKEPRRIQSNFHCKQGDVIEMCLIGNELLFKCTNTDIDETIRCDENVKNARYKAAIYAFPHYGNKYGDIEIQLV